MGDGLNMKRFLVIGFCFSTILYAETPTPNPELDAAKARIATLERALDIAKQKLAATESKSKLCFDSLIGIFNAADMKLNQLAQQEPNKVEDVKK